MRTFIFLERPNKMLSPDDFYAAGSLTQFVAIDLLVEDDHGRYLFGKRTNKPARGTWFVPGSKTFRGSLLRDDLKRITEFELGFRASVEDVDFLGVFDHRHPDNARDEAYGTHYIVLAVRLRVNGDQVEKIKKVFGDQHEEMAWMTKGDLLKDADVHPFCKAYFMPNPDNGFWQARVL